MSETKYSLDALMPYVISTQHNLTEAGIPSLIGGGVGVDLLAITYLNDVTPRPHSDIDIYIPITNRGKTLKLLESQGHQISLRSYRTTDIITSSKERIPYNFISIDGIGARPFVPTMSILGEEVNRIRRQNGLFSMPNRRNNLYINVAPEIIDFNSYQLLLMKAESQLVIVREFVSFNKERKRDLNLINGIISRK